MICIYSDTKRSRHVASHYDHGILYAVLALQQHYDDYIVRDALLEPRILDIVAVNVTDNED